MSIRQKTVQALAMAGVIAMVLFLAGCGGGGGGSSSNMMTEEPMGPMEPMDDPMNDADMRNDEMLELFVQANGMGEDNEAQQMAEAMRFGDALAAAADRNNGKPTLCIELAGVPGCDLTPMPTATWAAGSQLQISISPDPDGGAYFQALTTGLDHEGDPAMNFNMIDGLGDFMHGFEIERMAVGDATPLDKAKAIVFTDKQQGTAAIEAVTPLDAGSLTNQVVGTGTDAVMFDVSDVSDDGNTIMNVMFFEIAGLRTTDPGAAYMGELECPAATACSYEVAANGDITITGYRFTGTREARAMVTAVPAQENNDYLVFGLWLLENNIGEWESIGAIAGGGDPVTGAGAISELDNLAGQVTYTGKAFGAHHMDGMTSWFDADASIMIDFDASTSTGTEWGTVMGEISNIRIAGGAMHGDSIYLRADGMTGQATFTGTAAMGEESRPNLGDYPFQGGWMGALYSYGPNADYPDGVAGTFGVTNMDDTETFVGAFGARMEMTQETP